MTKAEVTEALLVRLKGACKRWSLKYPPDRQALVRDIRALLAAHREAEGQLAEAKTTIEDKAEEIDRLRGESWMDASDLKELARIMADYDIDGTLDSKDVRGLVCFYDDQADEICRVRARVKELEAEQ